LKKPGWFFLGHFFLQQPWLMYSTIP